MDLVSNFSWNWCWLPIRSDPGRWWEAMEVVSVSFGYVFLYLAGKHLSVVIVFWILDVQTSENIFDQFSEIISFCGFVRCIWEFLLVYFRQLLELTVGHSCRGLDNIFPCNKPFRVLFGFAILHTPINLLSSVCLIPIRKSFSVHKIYSSSQKLPLI